MCVHTRTHRHPPHLRKIILDNKDQFYMCLEQFLVTENPLHIKGPDGILGGFPIHFPIIKSSKWSRKYGQSNYPILQSVHRTILKSLYKCNLYPCNLGQTQDQFTQNSKTPPLPCESAQWEMNGIKESAVDPKGHWDPVASTLPSLALLRSLSSSEPYSNSS